jgi:hypothetical protein
MHAPGYAITAEKDAVLGEDLSSLLHTVPGLTGGGKQPGVVLLEPPAAVRVPPPRLRVRA